jgi:hypothetical protein
MCKKNLIIVKQKDVNTWNGILQTDNTKYLISNYSMSDSILKKLR